MHGNDAAPNLLMQTTSDAFQSSSTVAKLADSFGLQCESQRLTCEVDTTAYEPVATQSPASSSTKSIASIAAVSSLASTAEMACTAGMLVNATCG